MCDSMAFWPKVSEVAAITSHNELHANHNELSWLFALRPPAGLLNSLTCSNRRGQGTDVVARCAAGLDGCLNDQAVKPFPYQMMGVWSAPVYQLVKLNQRAGGHLRDFGLLDGHVPLCSLQRAIQRHRGALPRLPACPPLTAAPSW